MGNPVPEPHTFLVFAAASALLVIVPGPAVIYIVTRSVRHGRAAGLVSTLGIEVGGLVHVAAATVGLSALLASSCWRARLVIEVEGAETVTLDEKQGYTVPLGVMHKTSAPERTVILMVESAGVVPTGD
jgi:hypothetical protein